MNGTVQLTSISEKCQLKKCDGSGFIIFGKFVNFKKVRDFAISCDCQVFKYTHLLFERSNVPINLKGSLVNSYDPSLYVEETDRKIAINAKHIAIEYVKKFEEDKVEGKGLYLYSETKGCGKTHLSVSMMNAVIKKYQVPALYFTSVELLNRVKETFHNKRDFSGENIKKKVKSAKILLLDDFASEKNSDWVEEFFTDILDHRMINELPTIFTSNISIDQLNSHYPRGRISSRISKLAIPVQMPSEDIRKKQAAAENKKVLDNFFSSDHL